MCSIQQHIQVGYIMFGVLQHVQVVYYSCSIQQVGYDTCNIRLSSRYV